MYLEEQLQKTIQEELKQKELLEANAQSGRTYEEVMAFVKGKKK